jgi:hypothetical protein
VPSSNEGQADPSALNQGSSQTLDQTPSPLPDLHPVLTTPVGWTFTDHVDENTSVVWRVLYEDEALYRLIITEYVHGYETAYHSANTFVPLHRSNVLRPALNAWFYDNLSPELRMRAVTAANVDGDVRSEPGGRDGWQRENAAEGWTIPDSGSFVTASNTIFILSVSEVNRYFGDNLADRVAIRVDDILTAPWWLRSPGAGATLVTNNTMSFVDSTGIIHPSRANRYSNIGFRPAMWINLGV